MKNELNWLLAIVFCAGVFTACTSEDDNAVRPATPVVEVDINETNFPDENFRRFLLEQDYGKDGMLTSAEIASITVMDIAKKDIESLKGIEFFTALDTLDCFDNYLDVLDVSKNVALRELICAANVLTALDVSKNKKLEILYCGFNYLTSLDVSENTALIKLACHFNELTSLDVSQNTALTDLYCNTNHLERLDVSQNTALTDLYCGSNELTTLDVSKNSALTDLSCSGNELTTLDVSKNSALTNLYCAGNKLTELVIPSNSPLSTLFLSRNKISGKNMDDLISSLPQNTSSERHMFAVIDNLDGDEENVFTKSQSDAVKAKGWLPVYWDEKDKEWKELD